MITPTVAYAVTLIKKKKRNVSASSNKKPILTSSQTKLRFYHLCQAKTTTLSVTKKNTKESNFTAKSNPATRKTEKTKNNIQKNKNSGSRQTLTTRIKKIPDLN